MDKLFDKFLSRNSLFMSVLQVTTRNTTISQVNRSPDSDAQHFLLLYNKIIFPAYILPG